MIKYSVKKPLTVLVSVILVLVLGVVSFLGLSTDLLPTISLPYVVIVTAYPGASPERVEVAVTQPIEQSVATISGLENITSTSSENASTVILEFSESINMDSVMIDLNNNIQAVSGYFDDMVQPPMIIKMNPDMLPIQMLSIDVEGMDVKELTAYVEDEFQPYLERIAGVATVDVEGAVEDYVEIQLVQSKIDEINDNILGALDEELLDAKYEIIDGQNELKDGLAELDTEKNNAFQDLADGKAELDSGIAELHAITSEAGELELEKGLLEVQLELIDTRVDLEDVQIPAMEDALILFASLNSVGIGITDTNTLAEVGAINSILADAMQDLITSGLVTNETTVGEAKLIINGTITELKKAVADINTQLTAMGVDTATATSSSITDLITQIDKDLVQANFLAAQMESTIKTLQDTYADLELAQMQVVNELTLVEAQLTSAEAEIEAALNSFETERDNALKSANIDGLVTQQTLAGILTAQNFSMPAGYINDEDEKISVKIGDEFTSIEQLESLLLIDMGLDGVEPVYLGDVATISIKDNQDESYTRINGNAGVMLSIQKSSVASTTEVTSSINEAVEKLEEENPDVRVTTLMDQGVYIGIIIDSVMNNLLYGGIIAFFVLLLFLKDLKPTLIIAFSIPISLLFSIVLMYFSGVTLNIISLSGLALGVGMLVDNSVVVIENIYRLRNEGYSKVKAAVIGASQVGGAIFSSTLTTVSVFVPIVFVEGISRQLFTDMGLTIAYSLFASLLVALTIVPAMASTMLTSSKQKEHKLFDKFTAFYEKSLRFNLKHRWIVILFTISLLGLSIFNTMSMPLVFIPEMDSTEMQMTLTLEETPKDLVIQAGEDIAKRVEGIEGIETVGLSMSSGGNMLMGGGGEDTINYYITVTPDSGRTNVDITEEIKSLTTDYADNLSITSSSMDISALSGSGVSYVIKGNDLNTLQETATALGNILKDVEGVGEVYDGSSELNDEVKIEVNKSSAMEHGLTVAQVFQKISEELTEETIATTLTLEGKELDTILVPYTSYDITDLSNIVMATEPSEEEDEDDIDILLKDIANIYMGTTSQNINRDNQSRTQTVAVTIADGYNVGLVSRDLEEAFNTFTPPAGYSIEVTGENETITSTITDMVMMIGLAIIFIYLIMVAQFQSLLSPFIILFTIPLAFTGGLLALQILSMELSITSLIGFLVLSGVVVNNGIVFVDYVNQLRLEEGLSKHEALVKAGRDRIRPILMTALTTILAMSTMALGVGMGAQMSQGMAIVTIGGLSYATVLTLFLVPVLYDILHRRELNKIDVDFEVE